MGSTERQGFCPLRMMVVLTASASRSGAPIGQQAIVPGCDDAFTPVVVRRQRRTPFGTRDRAFIGEYARCEWANAALEAAREALPAGFDDAECVARLRAWVALKLGVGA